MKEIDTLDWQHITEDLHNKGYGLIDQVLSKDECDQLIISYNEPVHYRKTIVMERYRFGLGEYKYFQYPLPAVIQHLRESIYSKLAPVANKWMQVLNINQHYPAVFRDFQTQCHEKHQTKTTVLILKYGEGGHNTLHKDLYGDIFFPIQLVIFLSEPGTDYEGGEFVLTQQTPRAQSKAIVLKPKKGDILLFTTNFKPVKGTKGYYRVNMKHGVSEVQSGSRYTLGIIFHDALS
ncbi:2OG-Fe(II) oxygenase [Dyadobacter fanqingshengii]|uniref:2OG-Fe(II) oxygenase n=1 Tax=Dyadobacter fanqingshengii TaxID=2906443 RepID=A0A9X1PBR1_9BACT|nr:2OG-Fe(II) oxygenase [Dyadobacter fanqingshengii]MCF0040993.1 2OG-Fe(II) oxygenase [Dyadobacter fanqingshengii]USJ37276.1 2OG-Fe(II) oxygenase [Dyadobacter fanqingshengii]